MDAQKLAKVLALAASDNETEALQALRTAKRLLETQGSDFVTLAGKLSAGDSEMWKDAVFDLRNEVRGLRAENEKLRQGRAGPTGQAPSFQETARDAAELIRLRAELEAVRLEAQQARAQEAAAQAQYRHALAEAGDLAVKVSEAETRRMRLEAENRRLTHANHALRGDLAEAQAAGASERSAGAVSGPQPSAPEDSSSRMVALHPTQGRTKKTETSPKGRGQYALF